MYPIRIAVIKGFSLKEKGWILEALAEWQEGTGGIIAFHAIDWDTDHLIDHSDPYTCQTINIIKIESDNQSIKTLDKQYDNVTLLAYACADKTYSMVVMIIDRIQDKYFKILVMHEIGHRLGLGHTEDKSSVMHQYVTSMTDKVTDLDLWMLIYECRIGVLQQ